MSKKLILEHELVPMHEILDDNEVALVLDNFGIVKDQLPKIKESDPVVKAISAKRGNVLKISRRSQTASESIYYRLVIG